MYCEKKLKEEFNKLERGILPGTIRGFKMPFVCKEWDEPLPNHPDLSTVSITIGQGVTWRQAKDKLFLGYQKLAKGFDIDVQKPKVAGHRKETDFETLKAKMMDPLDTEATQMKEFGVPNIDPQNFITPTMKQAIRQIPTWYVRKIMRKKAQEKIAKDAVDRVQIDADEKTLEATAKLNPEMRWKRAVVQAVREEKGIFKEGGYFIALQADQAQE